MKNKTIHAYYSGIVQGVGFRFTARMIANRHSVKGWVRNLSDGRVELLASGSDKDVDNFFIDLRNEFKRSISESNESQVKCDEEHTGFGIRF
tara:strand:- start:144 stop:419 length:276 start_codon:yes stop_codon:yes gene_type:complete